MATGKRGWNLADPTWRERHPAPSGENHYAWKGDAAATNTGRQRARALFPDLGTCQECGKVPAVERHHLDGDTTNNAESNVRKVCRRCHMKLDGRLEAFLKAGAQARRTEPQKCRTCPRVYKPLRRGLCAACYMRERRGV